MSSTARCVRQSADSANWLFSQMKTTGSLHVAARFIPSCTAPWPAAPSPKYATTAWSVPRSFAVSAGAARVRDAGADDPVAAEDVEREVGDVHRAAEALGSSPSACRTSRPSSGAGRRRPRSGGRASGGGRRGSPCRASRSRRRRRSPPGRRSCAPCRRSRPARNSSAARSSKRRISAICRYCATRALGDGAHRGGRWLNSMM